MKSSLGKLGRKLSMSRSDVKDKRDYLPSSHLEDLAQASKDMQDMRNCYDTLLSAAAATANSIYEFSESLHEMGTCLLDKTTLDTDDESGRVLSALGNMQSEIQKIADTYRSYVIVTVTNPTESLLSELRKVEEMKLQCDEKREAYEYMMAQHKEKGRLRSGKHETSAVQKLQEAQEEYDVVARLCVFRVKSLKEGQCRSLLAQAARHHAAQLDFFRKGLKALEAVDPYIRIVAEKHRIDYQLSGLNDVAIGDGEGISSYESTDDGELSFDYRQKTQGVDSVATSSNLMEVDRVYPHVPSLADSEINVNKYQGEQLFGRQARVGSYSAPIFPEKTDPSGKPKEMQGARKFHSYVLPPPVVDSKSTVSRTPAPGSHTIPFQNLQQPLPVALEKHERDIGDDSTSTSAAAAASKARPMEKDSNVTNSFTHLPAPLAERLSFPQRDTHTAFDGKPVKRQAYSGPLPPSKSFSGRIASSSRPVASSELPPMLSRVPVSQSSNVSRSVSPPPSSSPNLSELHELPRPPSSLNVSKPLASSSGLVGHSAPLFYKNQETTPPNKIPIPTASAASPLPPPPLVVPRSFSIPSRNQRAMALHVAKLMESPHIKGKPGEVASPPLTPISLANMKPLSTLSEVASDVGRI